MKRIVLPVCFALVLALRRAFDRNKMTTAMTEECAWLDSPKG